MNPSIRPTVHARGTTQRLDAVMDLVAYASRSQPLSVFLDELPRRLASVFGADVCSTYLIEGKELVMRGNIGFPPSALGAVRLPSGQGITGFAVECMRPVSLSVAAEDAHYRHFPALGEEHFPVFLAVPVIGPARPMGAVVLQRREPPAFSDADIELAVALTAPIAAAVERARLTEALRDQDAPVHRGARRVTLPGRSGHPGRAVGAVSAMRRPVARRRKRRGPEIEDNQRLLDQGLAQARRALEQQRQHAVALGMASTFLEDCLTILADARLRARALEYSADGSGLGYALECIGRDTSRAAATSGDPHSLARAQLIADLCDALSVLATGDERVKLPRGAVLVGDRISIFDLLVSQRAQPVGLVLGEPADSELAGSLLKLLGLPAVVDVPGVFRWVSDGDLVLVDGDHGLLRVSPSRAEIAALRAERKKLAP